MFFKKSWDKKWEDEVKKESNFIYNQSRGTLNVYITPLICYWHTASLQYFKGLKQIIVENTDTSEIEFNKRISRLSRKEILEALKLYNIWHLARTLNMQDPNSITNSYIIQYLGMGGDRIDYRKRIFDIMRFNETGRDYLYEIYDLFDLGLDKEKWTKESFRHCNKILRKIGFPEHENNALILMLMQNKRSIDCDLYDDILHEHIKDTKNNDYFIRNK